MPKQKPPPTPKLVTLKEANSLLPKVQQTLNRLREHRDRMNEIGARRDLIYLCWKEGEEDIRHWHDLESGFSGRRPL